MTAQPQRLSRVPETRLAEARPSPSQELRSLEMEMAALGAMLMLDEEAVTSGMKRLHARHFTGSFNPLIFRAIRAAEERRTRGDSGLQRIDIIVVADEIRYAGHSGTLEEAGGAAYLTALIESCPSSVNIDRYINQVIWWSKKRFGREAVAEYARRIVAPDSDPDRLSCALMVAMGEIGLNGHADVAAIFGKEK